MLAELTSRAFAFFNTSTCTANQTAFARTAFDNAFNDFHTMYLSERTGMSIGKLSYDDIPLLRTRYFGNLSLDQSAFVAGTHPPLPSKEKLPEELTSSFGRRHPSHQILLRNRQPHNLLRPTRHRLPPGYGLYEPPRLGHLHHHRRKLAVYRPLSGILRPAAKEYCTCQSPRSK